MSMDSLCGEPVCLWLPKEYQKPGTSTYVQGVEFTIYVIYAVISILSVGMMVGGIAKNAKIASALYFPMLIFSGATLPFEVMPELMQKIVAIFPLTQGIQLMKAAFLGLSVKNL